MLDRQRLIEQIKQNCLDLSVYFAEKLTITVNVNSKVKNASLNIELKDIE